MTEPGYLTTGWSPGDSVGENEMRETQQSISWWASETFGPVSSNIRVAARANEEMAELLRALSTNDKNPKAHEEMADVLIVLFRLAARMGIDLLDAVDKKMEINRSREWKLDGSGHGYHVRDKEPHAHDKAQG
jgi:NTP pyrophosphatase (non-canonical NTP hydrolase)